MKQPYQPFDPKKFGEQFYADQKQKQREIAAGWRPGMAYWYCYGWKEVKNSKGELVTRLYTDGPFLDKREAEFKLQELNLDAGDVHESVSRDLAKVKKQIAAMLVHEQHMTVEKATDRKYRG